jgi:hypothetical protein
MKHSKTSAFLTKATQTYTSTTSTNTNQKIENFSFGHTNSVCSSRWLDSRIHYFEKECLGYPTPRFLSFLTFQNKKFPYGKILNLSTFLRPFYHSFSMGRRLVLTVNLLVAGA